MTMYLSDDEHGRVVLDTKKAVLQYENTTMDLTGRVISCYDMDFYVEDGFIGPNQEIAAKILIMVDRFTGIRFEIPLNKKEETKFLRKKLK